MGEMYDIDKYRRSLQEHVRKLDDPENPNGSEAAMNRGRMQLSERMSWGNYHTVFQRMFHRFGNNVDLLRISTGLMTRQEFHAQTEEQIRRTGRYALGATVTGAVVIGASAFFARQAYSEEVEQPQPTVTVILDSQTCAHDPAELDARQGQEIIENPRGVFCIASGPDTVIVPAEPVHEQPNYTG